MRPTDETIRARNDDARPHARTVGKRRGHPFVHFARYRIPIAASGRMAAFVITSSGGQEVPSYDQQERFREKMVNTHQLEYPTIPFSSLSPTIAIIYPFFVMDTSIPQSKSYRSGEPVMSARPLAIGR
ncbi:alpha/beta-hydrolase [Anopheles sinensis]|uniref:Alpha/beta-hydrolase n=1 Tax=Anopheles sinensis TaxID=74873 RepID=A0A084WBI2_ANOSI|nr:alpha/beta-hydrolase [Anopheles sinensis]